MSLVSERYGFELPLLLGGAFRSIIDELHGELARRGHGEARPVHGFALQAIGTEGATLSELGRRLGVSKQAAAKTVAGLESLGYAVREPDTDDGRATRVRRTRRGDAFLGESAEIFELLRARWVEELGADRVRALEEDLERMAARGGGARVTDFPGWMR
jgi:DNA-binding MarR family transcriptional regulator